MPNPIVIEVTGDKTLDNNDAGFLQRVTSAAVITIPKDVFISNDHVAIFRDTTDTVSVVGATGVTINAIGLNISPQCGRAKFIKVDTNTWIGWGDLT